MIWVDKIKQVAAKLGMPDPDNTGVVGQLAVPRYLKDEVEDALLMESQALLREVPPELLESIGSAGISIVSDTTPIEVPLNCIGILSVITENGPAVEASVAGYYQRRNITTGLTAVWAMNWDSATSKGRVYWTGGGTAKVVFIVEPALSVWQSDVAILPPGYESEQIDRTFEFLQAPMNMPMGVV